MAGGLNTMQGRPFKERAVFLFCEAPSKGIYFPQMNRCYCFRHSFRIARVISGLFEKE